MIGDAIFLPRRIVSGGQTGVDRGALEAALALNLAHGGWCPRGRLAEDGTIPSRYQLEELDSPDYAARTEQNVLDSDATLVLHERSLRGGTLLTVRLARRLGKPLQVVAIDTHWEPATIQRWLAEVQPPVLNVAGPRESTHPGIEQRSLQAMLRILCPKAVSRRR